MNKKFTQFIKTALSEKVSSNEELYHLKRRFAKQYQTKFPTNNTILAQYRQMVKNRLVKENSELEKVLRIRKIRTLSGIASIGVHTKPLPCPGKCLYCPDEKNMPKSYLSTQPAVIRSSSLGFDPYKMVQTRLKTYLVNGHPTDKCELIVMGGTWSYHHPVYQVWFLKRCFDAFNAGIKGKPVGKGFREPKPAADLRKLIKKLKEAQKINETADCRVVGLTLETRPDFVSQKEIKWMRELGATRVEIGVQSTHDQILNLNKRGHWSKSTVRATKLFKDAGFKITYHMMPGLYGSTPKLDREMFKKIFTNSNFQPDQIKIYPTIVSKYAKLYKLWQSGQYKPYDDLTLKNLLKKIKLLCPPNIRITRLFRDIPRQSIYGGMQITNIRQIIQEELKAEKKKCRCIRCREPKGKAADPKQAKLKKREYRASRGKEIFLSFESNDESVIYAFCRIRFPAHKNSNHYISALRNAALIRELHTYGELIPISKKGKVQHKGLGKQLMEKAELLAKKNGYKKIAVISGIGVREYYRKLGYKLEDEYMVKDF